MSRMTLYLFPGGCSRVTACALEKAGADYDAVMIDLMKGEHMQAQYQRINPRGKIPALTETGYPNGLSKCKKPRPFTNLLLAPLRDDPVARRVAWMLLWRNANEEHFWVPPATHPYARDFRDFHEDPYTHFGDTRLLIP